MTDQIYDQAAEQALIAIALSGTDVTDVSASWQFHEPVHRAIWNALTEIYESGKSPDIITVSDAVRTTTRRESLDYVARLREMEPPAESAKDYAAIIFRHALDRAIVKASADFSRISSSSIPPSEKTAAISAIVGELDSIEDTGTKFSVSLSQAVREAIEKMEAVGNGSSSVVMTGFSDLDAYLGGLMGGELVVLAGRPGMGKTSFAMNIAENVSVSSGHVMVFSMEMTRAQLAGRMISGISGVDASLIRAGSLTDYHYGKISEAIPVLDRMNISIDDRAGLSIQDIRASIRKSVREHGKISLVVIDYIQLISSRQGSSRYESITEISKDIKALAKDLDVPVIALSQLNRDVDKRADKRPVPSDLRESGQLEQDADIILFVYRDEVYYKDSPSPGMAEIIISKHRSGESGTVGIGFDKKLTRFYETSDIRDSRDSVEYEIPESMPGLPIIA